MQGLPSRGRIVRTGRGRLARRIAPSNPLAQQSLAVALFFRKETAACLAAAERAIALNSLDGSNEAFFLITFAGDWERGCALIRRGMELNPHHLRWYELVLGLNEYRLGRYREAIVEVENANLLVGVSPWTISILAAAYGQLGDTVAANNVLREWPGPRAEVVHACTEFLDKWFEATLGEHLLDGRRKAGRAG